MQREIRSALVTGGARGIGKGIARQLAEAGFAVVITDSDAGAGRESAAELSALGPVLFVLADVASEASVAQLAATTLAAFGGLDLLVNNAGIMCRRPLEELSLADWNRTLAVNLTGPFLCARALAPLLKARQGVIVNIASTRALMSEPDTEAYAASKGGVVALTHALALSLGPAIRVNCISPGWIYTGDGKESSHDSSFDLSPEEHAQHPAGRVGRTEDVASLVLYLASPESSFITGANFIVDGGMTRKMIYT